MNQLLTELATERCYELARLLKENSRRIVFAESCTAGLVSAILGQVPGISQWLCGSAVVYQESTKQAWLKIDSELIARHSAVSREVTEPLARAVLSSTPDAELAVAITGHLEPTATKDGAHAFVASAVRDGGAIEQRGTDFLRLHQPTRVERQWEAALAVIDHAIRRLS